MTEMELLRQEVHEVLDYNILRFWIDRMQDHVNGGFYGRIDNQNRLHADADKGAILNARILWTFSAAYRVLGKPVYLEMATRAMRYFLDNFIDQEYGGVYWSLDYKGQPKDTKKQFYAIGFAVYGLSEYARATGNKEALDQAIELYHCIEQHALDREYNGYIEAMTRDWQPISDMRLSEHDANYPKSQNTHLHIIEPYTNLYRVWPSAELEMSLRNIIGIFTDKILNPETYHLDLFFDMDWTRGADQLESYGHDIECSWLLHEAALVLGDKEVLNKVEPIVQMVAKASEKGLNANGSMIHEANLTAGTVDDDLHWWVQAEAVVGFINIFQHFHDDRAFVKAIRCWQYIKDNLIDYGNGEWYWSRHKDGKLNTVEDKAGFWKCPYHNGRMCLEILEREL
jgi:mannobiose 2-epimerase